jgi:hypothetical protein
MTIREVRFNLKPLQLSLERELNRAHWGFTYWFDARLKAIRPELRGEEVKGVNIVNVDFCEPGYRMRTPENWLRIGNEMRWEHSFDLSTLVGIDPVANIARLMGIAAPAASGAPWPQVRAIGRAMAPSLDNSEIPNLQRYLAKWASHVGDPDDAA